MKAVILAGGLGTRISEETHPKPKPMIEIGGRPMLFTVLQLMVVTVVLFLVGKQVCFSIHKK